MHAVRSCILATSFLGWLPPGPSFTTAVVVAGIEQVWRCSRVSDHGCTWSGSNSSLGSEQQFPDSSQTISHIVFGSFKGVKEEEEFGRRWVVVRN